MGCIKRDIIAFIKAHWVHIILAIPAAVAFTALHELAHCVAVWLQGGEVLEFVWLPSQGEWGHMSYSFSEYHDHSTRIVSLAPYIFWVASCFIASILSLRQKPWKFWIASTIFVWLFIVPLADIANTALPYLLLDVSNDFQSAFGSSGVLISVSLTVFAVVMIILGFGIQKRLYRERDICVGAYYILVMMAVLAIFMITSLRTGWLG